MKQIKSICDLHTTECNVTLYMLFLCDGKELVDKCPSSKPWLLDIRELCARDSGMASVVQAGPL